MSSDFRVDIIQADGTNVGTSVNIGDLNNTKKLDTIGSLSFSLPASDPITRYIQAGTTFRIYDRVDGFLGTYLFRSKRISDKAGISTLTVECFDALQELTFHTVGFNRNYNYEDVSTVVEDVVTIVPGWSTNIEDGLGQTVISYQGESVFRALDEQRDRQSAHFRLDGDRVLQFGYFGEISNVVLSQVNGIVQSEFNNNLNLAIVSNIQLVEESEEIYNRIIPLGFGQGVSQLTISEAVLGDYAIEIGTNADGSSYYYIEDDTSVTNYGLRTRILSFPNIRPLSNSDANVINAANALKLTAESYLTNHINPRVEYQVDIVGLRSDLKVGNLVQLVYRGIVDNYKYIDVNEYFYIMDITYRRNSNGDRVTQLNIASVNERRTTDQDVMIDVIRDLRDIKVKIPATLAYSPIGPYVKRIKGHTNPASRVNANFVVRIKEEVLYLNRALLRIKTGTLKSSVTTSAAGGGVTTDATGHQHTWASVLGTPDGGGGFTTQTFSFSDGSNIWYFNALSNFDPSVTTQVFALNEFPEHTHTLPTHTHGMTYDVFADTNYPQNLNIVIDGTDVTSQLTDELTDTGAPFAPSNAEYEYEFDVTSILISAGLRQNHTIEIFSSTSSKGEIEFEVDMLVTIQPIRMQ